MIEPKYLPNEFQIEGSEFAFESYQAPDISPPRQKNCGI